MQKATQNPYFKGKLERIQQEWYENGAKMEILSYIENRKNNFLHTENFILVDKKLHISRVYNGTLQLEIGQLIKDIRELEKE